MGCCYVVGACIKKKNNNGQHGHNKLIFSISLCCKQQMIMSFSLCHVMFERDVMFPPAGVEVKALCPAWATGTDIKPRVDVDERKLAA